MAQVVDSRGVHVSSHLLLHTGVANGSKNPKTKRIGSSYIGVTNSCHLPQSRSDHGTDKRNRPKISRAFPGRFETVSNKVKGMHVATNCRKRDGVA